MRSRCKLVAGLRRACVVIAALAGAPLLSFSQSPLVQLTYRITGTQLQVSPAAVSVPKGVPGSVLVQLVNADGSTNGAPSSLTQGTHIEAVFRGPSFDARRLVGQLNAPLMLPTLSLVGDYELDDIRLIDTATGAVRMEASPSTVPVHVFDQVLISQVNSRPLTYDEIQQKGIVIDSSSFRAVEFQVGFVLNGQTIPIKLPVVAPTFSQSTEIIPQAEVDAKLAQAAAINQQIASTVQLPAALHSSGLNIDVQGINFQRVDVGDQSLALQIPPIPALMVIPGNIGYLHQFFSVQIFTENGAPSGSGLSVLNIQAHLNLPLGPDQIAENYDSPGDDPLRFARLGPNKIQQSTVPVARPGPDGVLGTADDIGRLYPGESGQGEFLIEGLQEGLQVLNLDLSADLDGLAGGIVKVTGKAAGSVLVRNPTFSLAFSHPRTVRAGEPYDAYVTILNTSPSPVNLVSVSLPQTSLSGGVLLSPDLVQLGTILPGQTATAHYRVLSQRTGAVSFSNLTTGSDAVTGRFRLTMGIDERGVALSPDTIGMPDFVDALPTNLVLAANRVLGQALSVATAPQLPASVLPVARSIITERVLELAEAGQRLRYGDSLKRVLADLLLDWQGGRNVDPGFDQILRSTDAGVAFREALFNEMENADALDATARLVERAPDFAGRAEAWQLASVDNPQVDMSVSTSAGAGSLDQSAIVQTAGYRGSRGDWLASGGASSDPSTIFHWAVTNSQPQVELAVLIFGTNGSAQQLRWSITNSPANACYYFPITNTAALLFADTNCDGTPDFAIAGTLTAVSERPPELLGVIQDPTVDAGRPDPSCLHATARNYGTVLAVLYSKPMAQQQVNVAGAYQLDDGNSADSVQIQAGARVALLNMLRPLGGIHQRVLSLSGITDPRGNSMLNAALPVQSGLQDGVALRGRVVRADGSPAGTIPVTLTMYDQFDDSIIGCTPFTVRVAQVNTDTNGFFTFDFVLADVPYSVSATDTGNLPPAAIQAILESTAGDSLARDKLLQLANSPSVANSLLSAFAVNNLPQAVAAVEGLDRAVLHDSVASGSPRIGTEVPVALRFRGRGNVAGKVLAADGVTSLPQVAVNLFPDPSSRELGRGVFTDASGSFSFNGVPLGLFTIQAANASGLARTVAGELDQVGQTTNITVVLSAATVSYTGLKGQVFEADNVTPHPNAQVFIGKYSGSTLANVVAAPTADASGFWNASGIPADTYDVVALSFDGTRKGDRRAVAASAGVTNQVAIALQGTARVVGRVETSTGAPVANALVAGGEALVRADNNGLFTLTGVPTGQRTISVGLEKNAAAGIDFPRFGSASLTVLPGIDNFVVVQLDAAGQVIGRVLDADGNPVPNVRVAMPLDDGFQWVYADGNGNYKFENLGLGQKTFSAPAPGAEDVNTAHLVSQIQNGSQDDIQAAIGEAYSIFTGAADPFLNGQGANFNPGVWGYTTANISYDGQTVVSDIHFLRTGTISGIVQNGQGVPIGARVRLTGVGPLPNGAPSFIIRGEQNSDPALGTFQFQNEALTGSWGLQAASPFYPTVITTNGQTSFIDPDATNIVLQFPPVQEVNGRLTGTVFNPDGTPAGSNVTVHISFGNDYAIETDTNGFFDTRIAIPAAGYTVEADDPATGLRGQAGVQVLAGVTNIVNVRLLGRGSVSVTVVEASGQPVSTAQINLDQGSFPGDHYQGTADTNGALLFANLFEGSYAVAAQIVSGPTTIYGRAAVQVVRDQTTSITVTLAPTANLQGTFLQRDLLTPVAFAQVSIGSLGFAVTDSNGVFSVSGLPLGTYRLYGQDAVNGRAAVQNVTLSTEGQTLQVQLIEQALGDVSGFVVDSYNTGFVPGASVTLTPSDGITPARTVSTGPDGSFDFPGTPSGSFELSAVDPASGLTGSQSATLPDGASVLKVNVALQSLARLTGVVYQPDGSTPASNTTVTISGAGKQISGDTDSSGRVSFVDLPLGSYSLTARALNVAESRSIVQTNMSLTQAGSAPDFAVELSGVGAVSGQVLDSSGFVPVPGATVTLAMNSGLINDALSTFTDNSGNFSFGNVAVGPYRLTVEAQALAASYNGQIRTNSQLDDVQLVLGASGSVSGRLVRNDGVTPVGGIDVLLTFNSQSGLPGRAVMATDADGNFLLNNIPVGPFTLEAVAPGVNGIAKLSGVLSGNGNTLALGAIRLDEDDPAVLSVSPANTAAGVPIVTTVDLLFNEPLDPSSLNHGGIYLRSPSGVVPAAVELLADPTNNLKRLVRLVPNASLQSLVSYDVIVLDGVRLNATGATVATGPQDLVGRYLSAPFVSHFTTADQTPPVLVSLTPSNKAVQVDPRSVIRLTFNKPIRETNFTITVSGPSGPVAGTAVVALNGLAIIFTPAALLQVNATYSVSVSGVTDLAGNVATGQPFVSSFATLDTIGPDLAVLRIADGLAPIAGATVPIEAELVADEPGASVRFTQDFTPVGAATNGPSYRVPVALPGSGTTVIRAMATDRYGNDGNVKELSVTVIPPQAPAVQLLRGTPTNGPIGSGQSFSLVVNASGDLPITNVTVIGLGAMAFTTNFTSGATNPIPLLLPVTAVPNTSLEFQAQASDVLGLKSPVVTLDLDVADTTPPSVTIVSPPDGATMDPTQPFNLLVASSDNSTNYQLQLILSGGLTTTQTLQVASLPNTILTNAFSVSLAGAPTNGVSLAATVMAMDDAGNSGSATHSYLLPDTTPPSLISLTPANQAIKASVLGPIDANFSEPIAQLSVNASSFMVRDAQGSHVPGQYLLLNGNQTARFTPAGQLAFGATYSVNLTTGITDIAGNPFAGFTSTFTTVSNLPPVLSFARVTPAAGPIGSGQSVTLSVGASSDLGIVDLSIVASGAISATNSFGDGATRSLTFTVPSETVPGTALQFQATARDAFGGTTGPMVISLEVIDATPPSLSILSPVDGTIIDPAQTLNVVVASEDNAGNHTFQVELSGAVVSTQIVNVVTTPNTMVTNTVAFSMAGALPDGSALQTTVRGTDASSNAAVVTRSFKLKDTIGPRLISVLPADGSSNVSLWLNDVSFQFNEAIASSTVISKNFLFTNNAALATSYGMTQDSPSLARLTPANLPLSPGVVYTNVLLPGITDLSSNALTQIDGAALPSSGLAQTFRTAQILGISPTNGTLVLSGQTLAVSVQFENGLGADFFRFILDGGIPYDAPVLPGAASAGTSIPLPAYASPKTATLAITAMKAGAAPYVLPTLTLNVVTSLPDTNVLTISGSNHITVTAGQSTNLILSFNAPGSSISLVDYSPPNPAPAFVSMSSLLITNDSQGGTGSVQVNFNPLDAAAGDYTITIRAAAKTGKTATFDIAVTVLSDPSLQVTRWNAAVDGNWSDASKWTAGVPSPGSVAVIDALGTYTVSLDIQPAMSGLVLNHSNATLYVSGNWAFNAPVEVRAGQVSIGYNHSLTVNQAFVNKGAVQLYDRDVNTYLNGAGWLENRGTIQASAVGSGGGQVQIRMPVSISGNGQLLLPANNYVAFYSGSSLASAGTIDIEQGATLTSANDGAPRDFTMLTGGQLQGLGVLQTAGANRLVLAEDISTPLTVQLLDSARVTGPGSLRLESSQTIAGTFEAPILFASGATIGSSSAVLTNWARIEPNAIVSINNNQSITFNSVVTNLGTFEFYSRDVNTYVNGLGRIENLGLITCSAVGSGGGAGQIRLPIDNTAPGTLLVSTNAYFGFYGGSVLNSSGNIEVQDGAILYFANESPEHDLICLPGNLFTGTGLLQFNGNNRLVMNTDAALPLRLQLNDVAKVSGSATLTIEANQSLIGTYEAPIEIADGATGAVSGAVFTNSLTVQTNGLLYVVNNQTLTLNGVLTNFGTLQLYSRDVNTYVNGSGRIENLGLVVSSPIGGGGGAAQFRLPFDNTAMGTLLVSSNAYVGFYAGSPLNSSGEVNVEDGASLYFAAEGPEHDLICLPGHRFAGTGLLQLNGNNRLVMNTDEALPLRLQLNDVSKVSGSSTLILQGNQSLIGTYEAPIEIADGGTSAVIGAVFTNSLIIQTNGLLYVANNQSLTLNGVLTNFGTLQLYSRDVNTYVNGSGRIENLGLVVSSPIGGGGGAAQFRLPFDNTATGTLLVSSNAYLGFYAGSPLNSSGEVNVEDGASLYFAAEGPEHDLICLPGHRFAGTGLLQFNGNNRLVLNTDEALPLRLQLNDVSKVSGSATLTLQGNQSLVGTYEAPIEIADGGTGAVSGAVFTNSLTVQTNGLLYVVNNQTMTLNGVLTNFGTLQLYSRDVNTYVNGSGRIENLGLVVSSPIGGGGGAAQFRLPFDNTATGTLLVSSNAYLGFYGGSRLDSSGEVNVQDGASLYFANESPEHDLTLLAGSRVIGSGLLQLNGNNRLVMLSDASISPSLRLNDVSIVTGPGLLTLQGAQTLTGTYEAPVQLDNATVAAISGATFTNSLTVQTNGLLYVNNNATLVINGVLTNLGTFRMLSRDVNTYLGGAGSVENFGLMEIESLGAGGAVAQVSVPLDVPSGGTLTVRSNAYLEFRSGSTMELSGVLTLEGGSFCWFENSSPPRSLILMNGAIIGGQGNLTMYGNNQLNIAGTAVLLGGNLNLADSSGVTGAGLLTVGSGATMSIDHSLNMPGSLTIAGAFSLANSSVVLTVTNKLTLSASGTLNNPGTVQAGAYENDGGIVNGNAPIVLGPTSMVISYLRLMPGPPVAPMIKSPTDGIGNELVLDWQGPAAGTFAVEQSSDLIHWTRVSTIVRRIGSGRFEANLGTSGGGRVFYRLHLLTR